MSTIEQESFATLAAASEGAYSGLDINGFTVVEKLEDPNTGFSLVIYKNPAAEEYIFAFRGTELSSQDIYTDLNVGMKQWSPDIREQVETRIYAYTAKKSDAIIHFTGHSLGGALAQYAAYEYAISASNAASGGDLQATFDLVTFNAQVGAIATRYVISFTEPYFLGHPVIFGFSLFRRSMKNGTSPASRIRPTPRRKNKTKPSRESKAAVCKKVLISSGGNKSDITAKVFYWG